MQLFPQTSISMARNSSVHAILGSSVLGMLMCRGAPMPNNDYTTIGSDIALCESRMQSICCVPVVSTAFSPYQRDGPRRHCLRRYSLLLKDGQFAALLPKQSGRESSRARLSPGGAQRSRSCPQSTPPTAAALAAAIGNR
jgi:hypothetical protein